VAYPNRKIVALLAWTVVLCMLITACGSPQSESSAGSGAASGEAAGTSAETGDASRPASSSGEQVTLTFASFSTGPDTDVFQKIIENYQAEHPNITIDMKVLPAQGFREQIDTQLAAGQGPDIVRGGFRGDFGHYAAAGSLVDLTPYLDAGYSDDFLPASWAVVTPGDKTYALPLLTDTFGVFYNTDYFEQMGVQVPQSMDECWSWDEFTALARRVKDVTDAEYGFAAPFQGSNSKRWLPFLYMNGGQLLGDDLRTPRINTPEGIEAIAWTQSWFTEGLVPLSSSMKSQEQIQNLFANGTIGMLIHGNYMMPFFDENMANYGWDVTYMPCDVEKASDLGGNGLGVTKDSQHPELAADFIKYMVQAENMREIVIANLFIPVRNSLLEQQIEYQKHADRMQLFQEQAQTIPQDMADVMALPEFSEIDRIVADQLELAFTANQDPAVTAQNIEAGINDLFNK